MRTICRSNTDCKGGQTKLVHTPDKNITVAEVFRDEGGVISLRWKKPGANVYESMSLAQFLDLIYKAAGTPA